MTNKELIEWLQQQPLDSEIKTWGDSDICELVPCRKPRIFYEYLDTGFSTLEEIKECFELDIEVTEDDCEKVIVME